VGLSDRDRCRRVCAQPAHAARPLRARDRCFFGVMLCSALAAADAQAVGRAGKECGIKKESVGHRGPCLAARHIRSLEQMPRVAAPCLAARHVWSRRQVPHVAASCLVGRHVWSRRQVPHVAASCLVSRLIQSLGHCLVAGSSVKRAPPARPTRRCSGRALRPEIGAILACGSVPTAVPISTARR